METDGAAGGGGRPVSVEEALELFWEGVLRASPPLVQLPAPDDASGDGLPPVPPDAPLPPTDGALNNNAAGAEQQRALGRAESNEGFAQASIWMLHNDP